MEKKEYNLEELLKKSPTEITHEEMLFVLENMNLEAITAAAMDRQNLITKKSNEDQYILTYRCYIITGLQLFNYNAIYLFIFLNPAFILPE